MATAYFTPAANQDLMDAWSFIARHSASGADEFFDVVKEKSQLVAENPNMGRARGELGEALRSFPIGRYVLYYKVLPDGIDVLRVLHSARDVNAIFSEEN